MGTVEGERTVEIKLSKEKKTHLKGQKERQVKMREVGRNSKGIVINKKERVNNNNNNNGQEGQ